MISFIHNKIEEEILNITSKSQICFFLKSAVNCLQFSKNEILKYTINPNKDFVYVCGLCDEVMELKDTIAHLDNDIRFLNHLLEGRDDNENS